MNALCFPVTAKDEGKHLGAFLREQGMSAGSIRAAKYHGGAFFADEQEIHTNYQVRAGQTILVHLAQEAETTVKPQPVSFRVAYEDEFAVVLEKPAGLAVHPTRNQPDNTLANGWLYLLAQRGQTGVFRPLNRLDRNTSGLVLCAQNSYAAPRLAQTSQKLYCAVVAGEMPVSPLGDDWQEIDAPIARRGDSIIGRCVSAEGKHAVTRYRVLAANSMASLVVCRLVTGRTHQIRVHFSWLGHPLLGDDLYGGPTEPIARQALHCAALWFSRLPDGDRVVTQSLLPQDMLQLCRRYALASDDDFLNRTLAAILAADGTDDRTCHDIPSTLQ